MARASPRHLNPLTAPPSTPLKNRPLCRSVSIGGSDASSIAKTVRRSWPLGRFDASPSGPVDWDNDVTRYEASLGYRIVRNAGVLLSAYEQIQANEVDADSRFAGIRLWWAF